MATTITWPSYLMTNSKRPFLNCIRSSCTVVGFTACIRRTSCNFGHNSFSRFSFLNVSYNSWVRSFRCVTLSVRSNVNGGRLDPSPLSRGTRLMRAIQAFQSKLKSKIQEIRKDLPVKLIFFLVGFYCATAFSTVIGQTGDWDILSAALAVVIVEGIGYLMYRDTLPLFNEVRSLITVFNYWKSGLALGLFLDSFKY